MQKADLTISPYVARNADERVAASKVLTLVSKGVFKSSFGRKNTKGTKYSVRYTGITNFHKIQ